MGFWVFMLCMELLMPLTMMGFGRRFMRRPPREINALFGYRTARSMQNEDTWAFAHALCGKIWWVGGLASFPVSVLVMLNVLGRSVETISWTGIGLCAVQLIGMLVTIFWTERALNKHFDATGNRR